MYYNIHDVIGVYTDVPLTQVPSYFVSDNVDEINLELRVGNLPFNKPKNTEVKRINYYYWIENNTLKVWYPMGARLRVSVDIKSRYIKLEANKRFWMLSSNYSKDCMIYRCLYLLVANTNYTFVHAGCLDYENVGILIIAPPDFGKTSITLLLTGKGWKLLGDDHVIISGKYAYCYPRPCTISPNTYTGGVVKGVSPYKKFLSLLGPIYSMYLKFIGSPSRSVEVPKEIVKNKTRLKYIFVLGGYSSKRVLKECEKDRAAEWCTMPLLPMSGYPDSYVDLYCYLGGISYNNIINSKFSYVKNIFRNLECFLVSGKSIKEWAETIYSYVVENEG